MLQQIKADRQKKHRPIVFIIKADLPEKNRENIRFNKEKNIRENFSRDLTNLKRYLFSYIDHCGKNQSDDARESRVAKDPS